MALPINKDIAQEIAKKKAKEKIAKKEALNKKKLKDTSRKSKSIPKPKGIIDVKALSQTVNASLPNDQKPKGLAKLGNIITNQGLQLVSAALPAAETYAIKLGIDMISDKIPDVCPSQSTIDSIINPINNLLENVNSTATFVEDINKLMQGISTGATVVATTSLILDALIPALTVAADSAPIAPGFLVAAVDKIDFANKKLIFKADGTPKLPEILIGIGSVTVATSLVSFYIKEIKSVLEKIIAVVKKCSPSTNILALNSSVNTLSKQQEQSSANQDNLYKGFLLKIVEVKFNEQLNQRKAIAYNGNGIPTLETELSFTTNTQTLVEELKLIIDESGLVGDYIPSAQPPQIDQDLFAEPFIGDKEVKIQILNNRIFQEQTKLNQETAKFLTQNKLDAYLRIPVPKYILPITTTNYTQNDILFKSFINEVNSRYPTDPESNSKKTLDKNVPILKLLFGNLRPYINNINVLLGEISFVEGKSLKVDIPLDGLNTPSAISVLNP